MAHGSAGRYGPPVLIFIVTAALFARVLRYPFLNWDDLDVFVRNEALRRADVVTWAFTTRYMEHYQPLTWLTWGALARTVGMTATGAHALNVVLHALCAAFVYVVIRAATHSGRPSGRPSWIAALATLFWSLHPLRVEVVAWASAMPYSLALLLALLSMIAWLSTRWWTAVLFFALSLLARPLAFAMPLIWLASGRRPSPATPLAAAAALAIAAAVVESSARQAATLAEFGVGPRLTLAASAPWRYLGRTIAPLNLTPLDPLALTPRTDIVAIALGVAGIAVVSIAAWRWRREHAVLALSWLAYLALLAPAMGLVPSGLQATADRYTYFAAVPLSVAAAAIARWRDTRAGLKARAYEQGKGQAVVAGCAVLFLAVLAWQQAAHWRDSIALWTHAVEIDARNDVALYNLGSALDEAGRTDEARAKYEQVVALVPGHAEARHNLDALRARQLEAEGNRLASGGKLAEAVTRYREATRLDPQRTHSHAALGVALTQLGRTAEARAHLQTAIAQGVNDPAVPNALAFVLVQSGDRDGALAVLRAAQRRFPNDPNIARNLAALRK